MKTGIHVDYMANGHLPCLPPRYLYETNRINGKRRPTDHPFNRKSARRQSVQSCGDASHILCSELGYLLHSKRIQRKPQKRWRGDRATSFVVAAEGLHLCSCFEWSKELSLALTTIYDLRLSKARRTVDRTDFRLDGWSVGRRFPFSWFFS